MVQLILTEEQARTLRQAQETVQLCDPRGIVLGRFQPEYGEELIAELRRRAAAPGPRFTGEQVRSHLRALQEAWDREGGFDRERMIQLLQELRAQDCQ